LAHVAFAHVEPRWAEGVDQRGGVAFDYPLEAGKAEDLRGDEALGRGLLRSAGRRLLRLGRRRPGIAWPLDRRHRGAARRERQEEERRTTSHDAPANGHGPGESPPPRRGQGRAGWRRES